MIALDFSKEKSKQEVFQDIEKYIQDIDLQYITKDIERPWGGFYVINETQTLQFIKLFFPDLNPSSINLNNKLSPKILVVAPGKRLSWQYHHRRSEVWKVIGGEAAISTSDTDQEKAVIEIKKGKLITLKQGERHRLIGTNTWGIIAEIWQHTDAQNPSDENDIVRVQDDFGR